MGDRFQSYIVHITIFISLRKCDTSEKYYCRSLIVPLQLLKVLFSSISSTYVTTQTAKSTI